MKLLDWIAFPGWEKTEETAPGAPLALTGATQALAAAAAGKLAEEGRRVLLVAEHDLKAARLADDVRQWTGNDCPFLPGGEIDLTRAAGSQESSWRRLEALSALGGGSQVLVTSAEALMQRMGRPEPFRQACFTLRPGDRMPPADLTARLIRMGYERVSMVEGKGQFALRGAILDLYPPAGKEGVRVEFFDDEVDSLRTFDCISQRSQDRLGEIRITPPYLPYNVKILLCGVAAVHSPENIAAAALYRQVQVIGDLLAVENRVDELIGGVLRVRGHEADNEVPFDAVEFPQKLRKSDLAA